jgi:hypothetical protein
LFRQVNSILDENATLAVDLEARDAESGHSVTERSLADRSASVSDEINARIPCVPPLDERLLRTGSQKDPVPLQTLTPTTASVVEPTQPTDVPAAEGESGKTAEQAQTVNPLAAGLKRQISAPRTGDGALSVAPATAPSAEPTVDREHAASHYAHDVENMQALQSQIAAMRVPGPVRWMQEQAARRLHIGGNAAAEGSQQPARADGSMKSGGSAKHTKELMSAHKRGPDNV